MSPFEQAFMILKNDVLQDMIADKILEVYGPKEGMKRLRAAPRQVGVLPFDKLANLLNHEDDVLLPEGAEKFPSLLHGLAAREAESNKKPLPSTRMDEFVDDEIHDLMMERRIYDEHNDTYVKNPLHYSFDPSKQRDEDISRHMREFRYSPKGEKMLSDLERHQKINRIKNIIGETHTPMKLPSSDIQDRMQLEEIRGSEVPAQMAQQKMGIAPGDLPLEQFEQAFPIDQDIGMSKVGVSQSPYSQPVSEIQQFQEENQTKPYEGLGHLFG